MNYRRFVAIHEAGHAVVAMHVGKHIKALVIKDDEGGGYCESYDPTPKLSKHACSCLGGALATRLYCRDFDEWEKHSSWAWCSEDIKIFNEARDGMTYRQARAIALNILRCMKHEVMELAEILERDGQLNWNNAPAYMKS